MKISYHKIQAEGKDGRCKWEYDVNMVGGGEAEAEINRFKILTNPAQILIQVTTVLMHYSVQVIHVTTTTPNTHTPKQMFQ